MDYMAKELRRHGWEVRIRDHVLHADRGPLDDSGLPADGRTKIIAEFHNNEFVRGFLLVWRICDGVNCSFTLAGESAMPPHAHLLDPVSSTYLGLLLSVRLDAAVPTDLG